MMNKMISFSIIWLMFFFFFTIEQNPQAKKSYDEYIIFIDPGHGGYDGGAKGGNGIVEKDLNLLISIHLRNYLEQAGIRVYLTRDKDTDFVSPGKGTKKKRDLDKRIEMINQSDCDFFISIHMNSLRNPRWHGAQTFYYEEYAENKLLAECIQNSLIEVLQNTDRRPKTVKTLYLFKKVKKPGALIEAGFLSNPYEANLLKQVQYQDKVAFAIYGGILKYLNQEDNLLNY